LRERSIIAEPRSCEEEKNIQSEDVATVGENHKKDKERV